MIQIVNMMTMNRAAPPPSCVLTITSASSSSSSRTRNSTTLSLAMPFSEHGSSNINTRNGKMNMNASPSSIFLRLSSPTKHRVSMQSSVSATDRVVGALGYFLPFFNGLQYGRYIFMQYPRAELLFDPLFPILQAYRAVPYASFVAFFALYLAVVRNPSFSRYVRFNAMQAVVLDVLLVLPVIFERIFSPRRGVGYNLLVISYNAVFVFLVACFLFALVSCILGKTPRLPIVADAADAQM